MAKKRIVEAKAAAAGKTPAELLTELYREYGSQSRVAAALGIGQATLSQTLQRLKLREVTTLERAS